MEVNLFAESWFSAVTGHQFEPIAIVFVIDYAELSLCAIEHFLNKDCLRWHYIVRGVYFFYPWKFLEIVFLVLPFNSANEIDPELELRRNQS